MADPVATNTDDKSALSIPADIAEKYGDLIKLIKVSRSMDNSERQYWIDVLPIMSEDQVQNLRGILDNEKKQLDEATNAYSGGMKKNVKNVANEFDEELYREKKLARVAAEKLHEAEEKENETSILAELEEL